MIIDRAVLNKGSFNFTKAAEEKNAENLLVIRGDPELVKKYLANFEEHLGHSEKYEGR
jgi:phosphatidylserine/phosphatidylglycerophosphate/cardiolipin synthase-like enzyme